MRTLSRAMRLLCLAAGSSAFLAGPMIDVSSARRSAAWERTARSTMARIGAAQIAYKASDAGVYGTLDQLPGDLLARHELPEADRDGVMEIQGSLFKANACGDGITIVGWPVDHGRTGMAAWALQLPGSGLMGTRNAARRYSGRDHSPAADAAEPWPERAGYGRDGQRWSAISGS